MAGSKKLQSVKLNNRGAALVTVIVVVTFISILATIMLFAAGKNYHMKATDREIKQSFYGGETALEEIKSALMVETQEAYKWAYNKTMATLDFDGAGGNSKEKFNKLFVKEFERRWNANIAANSGSVDEYMRSLAENQYTSCISCTPLPEGMISHNGEGQDGKITIGTINFEYEVDGYLTIISTEYLIKAPDGCFGAMDISGAIDSKTEVVDCVLYQNWTKK